MQELEPTILEKANSWLNGSYDNDIKQEIQDFFDQEAYTQN